MTDIYTGSTRSSKRLTKRAWKEYLRKLHASYKKGEVIKKQNKEEHLRDEHDADTLLEENLDLI